MFGDFFGRHQELMAFIYLFLPNSTLIFSRIFQGIQPPNVKSVVVNKYLLRSNEIRTDLLSTNCEAPIKLVNTPFRK